MMVVWLALWLFGCWCAGLLSTKQMSGLLLIHSCNVWQRLRSQCHWVAQIPVVVELHPHVGALGSVFYIPLPAVLTTNHFS